MKLRLIFAVTCLALVMPAASRAAVGIGGVATQAEAEAGVNPWKVMTPLRTKQAIDALAPAGGGAVANTFDDSTFTVTNGTNVFLKSGTLRGLDREVWITIRTDGKTGTGTKEDPYDGSTAAKFDTALRSSVGWAATVGNWAGATNSCRVHIGPGLFETQGSAGIYDMFRDGQSYHIQGAGVGVTTLRLEDGTVNSTNTNARFFLHHSGALDYFELSHLTIDCNPAGQPLYPSTEDGNIGAAEILCLNGYIHDLDVIRPWRGHPTEAFPVFIGTPATSTPFSARGIIERVSVDLERGYTTALAVAADVGGVASGAIRDCVVTWDGVGGGEHYALGGWRLSHFEIANNIISNCTRGISMDVSHFTNIVVTGNTFHRVSNGITMSGAGGNIFNGFVFAANRFVNLLGTIFTDWGNSTNTFVYGNTFEGGTLGSGVKLSEFVSWPLLAPDGTEAAPSLASTNNTGTGLFFNNSGDSVRLSADGTNGVTVHPSVVRLHAQGSEHLFEFGEPESFSTRKYFRLSITNDNYSLQTVQQGVGDNKTLKLQPENGTVETGHLVPLDVGASKLAGTDADGNLTNLVVGSGPSLSGGTLSASGGGGPLFVQTANGSVTNNTTVASIWGTGTGSTNIPANTFTVGKTLKVTLRGWYRTDGQEGTYHDPSLEIRIGSTILASEGIGGFNSFTSGPPSTGLGWELTFFLTCRSTGGSGTIAVNGVWSVQHPEPSNGPEFMTRALLPYNPGLPGADGSYVHTIDTASALALDVRMGWSGNGDNQIITSTIGLIE